MIDSKAKVGSMLLPFSLALLPWHQTVGLITLLLYIGFQFSHRYYREEVWKRFLDFRNWSMLPYLYICYLFGLLWSVNLGYGWRDLETKLSLFAFPLLLLPLSLQSSNRRKIQLFFCCSLALLACTLLVLALIRYRTSGMSSEFFYTALSSPLMHPSYLALYFSLAVVFQLQRLTSTENRFERNVGMALLGFLLLFIVLLSARMALLSLIIVYPLLMWKWNHMYRSKPRLRLFLWIIPAFVIIAAKGLYTINDRITQISQSVSNSEVVDGGAHDSASGRLLIWKIGLDKALEAPVFGYGTGDVKDVLIQAYTESDFSYALERKLNAHNQFLQTYLAIGLPGFLLLLLACLRGLRQADTVFMALCMLFALNALTESLLETQKGVVFFAVFYALLRPAQRLGDESPV
ncbi:MAG: O-antigen ligase family protein [Bacteroidota bacterium]|jgi:O-antigen ligase